MNLIGTALAGIYVVVASRSASATPAEAGTSPDTGGGDITCKPGETKTSAVSQPDTTVKVTCQDTLVLEKVSGKPGDNLYVDANCSQPGVLSSVCPGATVEAAKQDGENESEVQKQDPDAETIATLWFPQLPASQQVVCVRCHEKGKSKEDCKAVITVAAAPAQGPQACAVGGTSITLGINQAGGSAQFACGKGRTLAPTKPSEAYADDCSKVETLKDMTRSDPQTKAGYVTLKVDKVKKKTLCYLCQPNKSGRQQKREQDDTCKVYVHVSGSTKFPSSVPYALALPCLAAMLRFT